MSHVRARPPGPHVAGVVGFFDSPSALMAATEKTRDAKWDSFDAFSPFPVHGLEKAQGLKRSPLPYVTLIFGLAGFSCAFLLQYWTSAVDWPLNIGGKPFNSWPAFVPVMFELTVLLAALSTVAAMFILNGLPNVKKRAFDPKITCDKFAVMIDAPKWFNDEEDEQKADAARVKRGARKFDVAEATEFLKSLGAKDVKTVHEEGWF